VNRFVLLLFFYSVIFFNGHCSAQSGPPPVPAGPLGDVDTAFIDEYTLTMKTLIDAHPLYVEISGSNLILHRNGQEESIRVLPDIYHALKDVAHIPFLTYLELAPLAVSDQKLTDQQVSALDVVIAKITSARDALPTGHFNDVQLKRQQQMIEESLKLLHSTVDARESIIPRCMTSHMRWGRS
jgi:hypothetical protein